MDKKERAEAYANTRFVVDLDGEPADIYVQQPIPLEVDLKMKALGVEAGAYLTAWNPGSEILDENENAIRQARLQNLIDEEGLHSFAGEGIDPKGDWEPEQSVLVLGIDRTKATEFAETFGQYSYVWIERGEPVELVFTTHWFEKNGPKR